MGLSVVLIEGGYERFGTCSSTTCEDVFVDTSRNRSRRHCSVLCTTRENVAAYRRRKKAQA
jgi:predicted RNA-binding Zn ribbon-like protein